MMQDVSWHQMNEPDAESGRYLPTHNTQIELYSVDNGVLRCHVCKRLLDNTKNNFGKVSIRLGILVQICDETLLESRLS